jgi:hypothetical protein
MNIEQMVFVFGSNLSGIHGAGAAKVAHKQRGAEWGVGEGMTGQCYALPTKGLRITPMPILEVQDHVGEFLQFAHDNPELEFQVTQVGCGLGGFSRDDIAPMFEYAPLNCYFDQMWKNYLPEHALYWGTYTVR